MIKSMGHYGYKTEKGEKENIGNSLSLLEDAKSPINYFENWLIQGELNTYPPFTIPTVSQVTKCVWRNFSL